MWRMQEKVVDSGEFDFDPMEKWTGGPREYSPSRSSKWGRTIRRRNETSGDLMLFAAVKHDVINSSETVLNSLDMLIARVEDDTS